MRVAELLERFARDEVRLRVAWGEPDRAVRGFKRLCRLFHGRVAARQEGPGLGARRCPCHFSGGEFGRLARPVHAQQCLRPLEPQLIVLRCVLGQSVRIE